MIEDVNRRFIKALRGRHAGEKCAIVCNGFSLPSRERLLRIKVPIIGVNTSCIEIEPGAPFVKSDYHVVVDSRAMKVYGARIGADAATWLFSNSPASHRTALVIKAIEKGRTFSTDLRQGAVFSGAGYVALQVAIHLGFRDIVFVALDLRVQRLAALRSQVHYYKNVEGLFNTYPVDFGMRAFQTQAGFMQRAKLFLERKGLVDRIVNTSETGVAPWERVKFDDEFKG